MTNQDARARFLEITRAKDDDIDLAEAALVIAAEDSPELDIDAYLRQLDALAVGARPRVEGANSDGERVIELNHFLFVERGFSGNRDDFYDRRNSLLNEVLERRTGIPITLCLVYMEVARRIGLVVRGINFPGHFLAKYVGTKEIIIDAFEGEVLNRRDCQQRLRAIFGPRAKLDDSYLRAATAREILVRILGNLKQVAINTHDFHRALSCCDRILGLDPGSPREIRDRGLVYQQLECYRAALDDQERFLALAPDDETADVIRANVVDLRRQAAHIS